MWHIFDSGKSIGTRGSEEGYIVSDEEHDMGARITLERSGCTAPVGYYLRDLWGVFSHGVCFHGRRRKKKYSNMKNELVIIMQEESAEVRYKKIEHFAGFY